jgi:hypothetical protein
MNRVFYILLPSLAACVGDTFTGIDLPDTGPALDGAAADGPDADADPPLDGSGGLDVSSGDADSGLGLDATLDAALPLFRRVFVTSATMTPDFGGLSQADAICASAASSVSLGGHWKAWLSSSSVSASIRLEHATVPYKLLDGMEIAKDWSGLTSGTLEHAIDLDEHKNFTNSSSATFTGTKADGSSGSTCLDWTTKSNAYSQTAGQSIAAATDSSWTQAFTYPCGGAEAMSLYCIEQP